MSVLGEVVCILLAPEIQNLKEAFIKRYKWITLDVGVKHSYLGMQMTIKQDCMEIDMQ
jgi:hypothetical protein